MNKEQLLKMVWDRLGSINRVTFEAKSRSQENSGWNGKGSGTVLLIKEKNVLLFNEKGSWTGSDGKTIDFSNKWRWTLDPIKQLISLEHLRFGPANPVFLFHLSPSDDQSLISLTPHLCKKDSYFGKLVCKTDYLKMNWQVIGPKKNEEIGFTWSS